MTTSAVSGANAQFSNQQNSSIASDFNAFLQLLTTQLANQDPLSPMDSNQFTEQLVQFASVEQSVNTNTKLDQLLEIVGASELQTASEYVGKNVIVDGRSMILDKFGSTSFFMKTEEKPAFLEVHVLDQEGNVVETLTPKLTAGDQQIIWNGRGADGYREPPGTYNVAIDARDVDGNPVDVQTGFSGVVNAVETTGDDVRVYVNGRRFNLEDVEAVLIHPQNEPEPDGETDPATDPTDEPDDTTSPADSSQDDEGVSS